LYPVGVVVLSASRARKVGGVYGRFLVYVSYSFDAAKAPDIGNIVIAVHR